MRIYLPCNINGTESFTEYTCSRLKECNLLGDSCGTLVGLSQIPTVLERETHKKTAEDDGREEPEPYAGEDVFDGCKHERRGR